MFHYHTTYTLPREFSCNRWEHAAADLRTKNRK